jgi:hypothetical protein
MCDYSLTTLSSRPAQEGERLLVCRFPTGSIGLASPVDLKTETPGGTTRQMVARLLGRFQDLDQPLVFLFAAGCVCRSRDKVGAAGCARRH